MLLAYAAAPHTRKAEIGRYACLTPRSGHGFQAVNPPPRTSPPGATGAQSGLPSLRGTFRGDSAMVRRLMLALALALPVAGVSVAQAPASRAEIMPRPDHGGEVRVSLHMNFFVPGTADDSDASFKAQEQVRRRLYDSAARECDLLRASIASACRVESINISINRNHRAQQAKGSASPAISVSGLR
jgi:hypothetical protein